MEHFDICKEGKQKKPINKLHLAISISKSLSLLNNMNIGIIKVYTLNYINVFIIFAKNS